MMKIMALQVLSEVAQNIQSADFYSLMSNEATEVSASDLLEMGRF